MKPVSGRLISVPTGFLALVGLVAVALALLPVARLTPLGSAAEPPPAQTGFAIVSVYVGGDRVSDTQIGPLGGATFGFFASRPTSYDETTGTVTGGTPAYTCTSAADGWCNLQVPIGTGAGQVAPDTRLWVAPTAAPAGWYGNPYWQTAPLTGGGRIQTQHVFQTPPLRSGGRYLSSDPTNAFMSDPGTTTSDAAFNTANGGTNNTGSNPTAIQRRMASGGTWPLSRANPPLPTQCGLNVALVVDLSSSVQQTNSLPALKTAMTTFVNALQGTPSQLAIVTFGTGSPANGFPTSNTGLLPVASSSDAQRVKDIYGGWSTIPTNYTNWDAGLGQVAALEGGQHIDLAVVITDGNPTVYGSIPGAQTNSPTIPGQSGFTRFREMENSVASANMVKALNTRVLAVGVGDGLDAGSARNLRSISGPSKYAAGGDIAAADYLQQASYDEVGEALRNLVVGACAPSISVIKQIIPNGGTVADAYTPAVPWTFTASTSTPGASVGPPPGVPSLSQDTDTHTGGTNFDVTLPDAGAGTFSVAETQKAGHTLHPVDGDNAVCVDKTHDDAPVTVTNGGGTDFAVDLVSDSAVSCIVYNEAPDFAQAAVVVHKRWQVTVAGQTETYNQYAQPPGLDASLRLGGPEPAGPTPQSWNDPRAGYRGADPVTPGAPPGESVEVAEDVDVTPPGCTFTSATMTGTGISGTLDLGTTDPAATVPEIGSGLNEWTITNAVTCRSQLTLVKEVHPGGSADPDSWTLDALGGDTALDGPTGTTGVTSDVTPDTVYQLAEQAGDDPELLNFVQPDLRPRPIEWPDSTGSVDCLQTDGGADQLGDPQGGDGSVGVPLGHHVTCTFTNTAAPLTVIKNVQGGTAGPGDFQFAVEPVAPFPDGLPSRHFAGEAPPGHRTIVRPGQLYRITEVSGPAGYQLVSLVCGVRTPRAAPGELVIPAGSAAICTATNSFSSWTAEKSADPPPGPVSPGTVITYTLTARHLEGSPTQDVHVSDDLSRVLTHASFVAGSIHASAGAARLDGSEIVWTIPELSGTQTVTFRVRVDDDAWGVTLVNRLGAHTTGTPPEPGDPGVDCAQVTGDPDCDRTTHHTPDRPSPTDAGGGAAGRLPDTGGPAPWWLVAGLLSLAAGGALLAGGRPRPRARTRQGGVVPLSGDDRA